MTTKEVSTHKRGHKDDLHIRATDERDTHSHHQYEISAPDGTKIATINFQKGKEDFNGVTDEALLALVSHRLHSFQNGNMASENNARAIENIKAAMAELHSRPRVKAEAA